MPAYKAAYIEESIKSILNQSYKDFKLIISDDCSPEDIKSIVDKIHDERITFRRNEVNIGGKDLVAHWNLLLNIAQSDYVILAPDDDIYSPNFLEEIDKLVERYPCVNVIKSRVQKIDESGDIIMMDRVYEEYIYQFDNIFHQSLPDHMSGIGNYVFKTDALKSIGGFKKYPLAWWSDVMTNIILSNKGLAITKDIHFTMRMTSLNISNRVSNLEEKKKKAIATMTCFGELSDLINKYKPLNKVQSVQLSFINHYFYQWIEDDILSSASAFSYNDIARFTSIYPMFRDNKIKRIILWWRWLKRN